MKLIKSNLEIIYFLLLFISCNKFSGEKNWDSSFLKGELSAIEFPKNLHWLNTKRPLTLEDLKGKVVILDFWTYCCINCIHVIPELKKLESKWKNELIVIGVHSAKFSQEKETGNIKNAILRYELSHPVINDSEFQLWNAYGIQAWPSFVIINPQGKVVGSHSGEDVFELFDKLISALVKEYDKENLISRKPIKEIIPESSNSVNSILSFPSKLTINKTGTNLFVSDSNHNRILNINLKSNEVQDIIGSGEIGKHDGSFSEATLNHPQGIFVYENKLYIADTENHSIRVADLNKKTLTTLFGTGFQSRSFNLSGNGKNVALNSPWDLVYYQEKLFVAMAGSHQIWSLDLNTKMAKPYAGSGHEDIIDGKLLDSSLAQPSGITLGNEEFYIADSEVSAIREVSFNLDGNIRTIVGKGLFNFGDVDGNWSHAKLQHPLGVLFSNDSLYIADTYNNKIKIIDFKKRQIKTFAGTGEKGYEDKSFYQSKFNEPSGLAIFNNLLYIADTNNHSIRVLDLKSKNVTTLNFTIPMKLVKKTSEVKPNFEHAEKISLGEISIAKSSEFVHLDFQLQKGTKWNFSAPFYFNIYSSENQNNLVFENLGYLEKPLIPLKLKINKVSESKTKFILEGIVYYCYENKSICLIKKFQGTGIANVHINGVLNPTLKIQLGI